MQMNNLCILIAVHLQAENYSRIVHDIRSAMFILICLEFAVINDDLENLFLILQYFCQFV